LILAKQEKAQRRSQQQTSNLFRHRRHSQRLRKFGIKPTTETDPIQLEAARLNLVKQANLQEAERVKTLLANLEAQLKANDAIKRYTDLLGVVADSKISAEEVIRLSQKWGISKEAVVAYTSAIFAVNDGKISTKEVDALAAQWGVTKSTGTDLS
jgi:hypothetical protein